jgi:DmsE family decaheme c-type cytochrome
VDVTAGPKNWFVVLTTLGLLASPFLLLDRGSAPAAQDEYHISEVCLDCHEDQHESLQFTPHQILAEDMEDHARIACTSCHLGDEGHWEDDPDEHAMTNPAKLPAINQAQLCAQCHENSHQQNMLEGNVHSDNEINCSGCHQIHGSDHVGLLKEKESELCLDCHTDVRGQFAYPFRHPVNDGIVKCSECHTNLDVDRTRVGMTNMDNACFSCHMEFQGPFPYPHAAALHYSTEEGSCMTCHEPHGSHLARMLKQPYEAPHYQLCTQCHSLPPKHFNNSFHGTMWASYSCNECHVDIHGSYVSRRLLSESLVGQGCINGSCHRL